MIIGKRDGTLSRFPKMRFNGVDLWFVYNFNIKIYLLKNNNGVTEHILEKTKTKQKKIVKYGEVDWYSKNYIWLIRRKD